MLEYESGIIGFPLRLLAREIFDKCVNKVGAEKVALITGEEKIIPKSPKYYICTVESMPPLTPHKTFPSTLEIFSTEFSTNFSIVQS